MQTRNEKKSRNEDAQIARPTHDPSPKQLAAELGLSLATVYRLLAAGALTAFKVGQSTRIHRESVESLRGTKATYADAYLKRLIDHDHARRSG